MNSTLAESMIRAATLLAAFAFCSTSEPGSRPLIAAEPASSTARPDDSVTCVDPLQFVPTPLQQETGATRIDTTLSSLVDVLRDNFQIPVLLDTPRIYDLGVSLETPVVLLPQLPLALQLDRELNLHGLDWVWDRGILTVTSRDYATTLLTVEHYPITGLLQRTTADRIARAILEMTGDEMFGPWTDIPGTGGVIHSMGEMLVIRQTARVHREIHSLLAALEKPDREVWCNEPAATMDLRRRLRQTRVPANFDNVPLSLVFKVLQTQSGIPFQLDGPRLHELNIKDDTRVSLRLPPLPVEQILPLILAPYDLSPVIQDGAVRITSVNPAFPTCTVVYDVNDIVGTLEDGENRLIELILDETGSDKDGPWADFQSAGGKVLFAAPGILVIRQTESALREIHDLLAVQHEAAAHRAPVAPQREWSIETRYYRVPGELSAGLVSAIRSQIAPDSWMEDVRPADDSPSDRIGRIEIVRVGTAWRTPPAENSKPASDPHENFDAVLLVTHDAEIQDEVNALLNLLLFGNAWTSQGNSVPTGILRNRRDAAHPNSIRSGEPLPRIRQGYGFGCYGFFN